MVGSRAWWTDPAARTLIRRAWLSIAEAATGIANNGYRDGPAVLPSATMLDTPDPADDTLWFEMLLSHLAHLVVAGASPADMLDASASWADSPLLAGAGLVHDTPQQRRSLLRQLSRQVLDAMPQPTHGFALRRTPRPQRNDSCDCGSGLKYKHCCLPLEQGMPAIDRVNMLPALLEAMPRRDWAQLAYSAIDPMAVAHAADEFLQAGQPAQAIALLGTPCYGRA